MAEIKSVLFKDRVLKTLKLLGAEYHIRFEGQEYGGPLVKKKTRRGSIHALGDLKNHVLPYIEKLKTPGDVVVIPAGKFMVDSIQTGAINNATRLFGKGAITTHMVGNTVEVMRVE